MDKKKLTNAENILSYVAIEVWNIKIERIFKFFSFS